MFVLTFTCPVDEIIDRTYADTDHAHPMGVGLEPSIEDALVALRLYKKYLELEKAGVFQEKLLEIYRHGKLHGWEVA